MGPGRMECYVLLPEQIESQNPGKQVLFPEEHEIEMVWNKVICLFAANRLGNTLLVSRDMKDENGSVVICVFTSDYEDIRMFFAC